MTFEMYNFQRNVHHKKLNKTNFKVFFLIKPQAIVDPNKNNKQIHVVAIQFFQTIVQTNSILK